MSQIIALGPGVWFWMACAAIGCFKVSGWLIEALAWLARRTPYRFGNLTGSPTIGVTFDGSRPTLLLWHRTLHSFPKVKPFPKDDFGTCNQTNTSGLCHNGCKQAGTCVKYLPGGQPRRAPEARP